MIECDDVLVHVGQEAKITARLVSRNILRLGLSLQGRIIQFSIDGEKAAEVETGRDGSAIMAYTPQEEREYSIVATCQPSRARQPVTAQATLFCRGARRDAIILDVDRTLFASSTFGAIFRRGRSVAPLEDAVDVTRALSQKYDLIVVTGRKSYLKRKTKRWLREKGFPPAPVFFAPAFRPSLGHERFKVKLIRELKQRWNNITIGIGDRDSDARAYLANGLKAIVLREKGACPRGAVMVPDWETIRATLLG